MKAATEPKRLLHLVTTFEFRTDCIFCDKSTVAIHNRDKSEVVKVRTFDFKSRIEEICNQRNDS